MNGGGGGPGCDAYPAAQAFASAADALVHCYWTHTAKRSWPDAEAACESEHGQLASITSDAENAFASALAMAAAPASSIWLGGTDDRVGSDMGGAGVYRWVTGEPFGYTNWMPGQPNGHCDSCAAAATPCHCDHRIVLGPDGTWDDWWQDTACGSICEAIPTP